MSASMKAQAQMPPELVDAPEQSKPSKSPKNYRGFVAGVFSGIAKLSGRLRGTPFLHRA
jgi:solute carrier family 25 carnitine/acylcarnitine transporter 20/29